MASKLLCAVLLCSLVLVGHANQDAESKIRRKKLFKKGLLGNQPLLGGGLLGEGLLGGNAAALASASSLSFGDLGFGKGKGASASFPPANDFAPGICQGYPFCVPGEIAPTFESAVPVCPPDFTLDSNGMCSQTQMYCMPGTQRVGDDKCCAEKVNTVCFPTMEPSCPGDCTTLGSICAPSKPYMDIFAKVNVEAVANPSPKEAATSSAFFKLLLPMIDLGKGALIAGAAAAVEKKVVSLPIAQLGKGKGVTPHDCGCKEQVVPKCFTKCCRQDKEVMCVPPKVKPIIIQPTLTCPNGGPPTPDGQCLCTPGGPAPCPAGTSECGVVGGRICVSDSLCFGLDQCKMVSLLMPYLQPVGCPAVGGGSAALASASASASAAGSGK